VTWGRWVFPPKKHGKIDLVVTETFQLLEVDMLQFVRMFLMCVIWWFFGDIPKKMQGKILGKIIATSSREFLVTPNRL